MKINKLILVFLSFIHFFVFISCNEDVKKTKPTDTPKSGTIDISVDESFEPVMKEQITMYEASNPGTKINAHYKSEADCLKDYFKDSINRLIIITRGLKPNEEKYMFDSLGFNPAWNEIATDAIAVIINKNNTDTFFSLDNLKQRLIGKFKREQTLVFDGLNRTSTVRFIQDSILKGNNFDTSVVKAVKNSDEVFDYIATHQNAIGFVGINRIGNPEDAKQLALLKKVKIALIQCDLCDKKPFILPTQQSILNRRYPLVRGLYYISKENYTGLGSGFIAFLKYERGQLIFRRSYLGPIMNFNVRNVNLNRNPEKK
ncbi:MAG: substrate-binding domain-containing protein [Ferruginibacter sp.]|nr:phosphate ABC transporter substrate-binding protein, PhoT family [Ferruginibacter sp.]